MGQATSLILGTLISSLGFGYFIYGKKQNNLMALVSGVLLMAFPYFIGNGYLLIALTALCMCLPRLIRF